MSILNTVSKVEAVVKKVLQFLVVVLFAFMSILVLAQVFTRYFTNNSLTWSEELSRFTLVWLIYLASVITYAEKGHIIVDVLVMNLRGRAAKAIRLVNCMCVLVFCVCIVLGAWEFVPTTAMQRSPANGIVMANVYIAIPVSMVLMILLTVKHILEIFMPGPGGGEEVAG
ncbi:MAG: TRAP transporter small permease [Planctomycetaceae bacterium]|nr:TRAP transporter small permease [Planctomycetaceae bacterium]